MLQCKEKLENWGKLNIKAITSTTIEVVDHLILTSMWFTLLPYSRVLHNISSVFNVFTSHNSWGECPFGKSTALLLPAASGPIVERQGGYEQRGVSTLHWEGKSMSENRFS